VGHSRLGLAFQLIANILNDERIKPREGGEWIKSAVFYILKRACETTPQ
ncbi:uncharacterized protein METZ01_LOCUS389546, partial [marine metagenome]